MKKRVTVPSACALALALGAGSAFSGDPPPEGIEIKYLENVGSACPSDSVSAVLEHGEDGSTVRVTLPAAAVSLGPGVPLIESRKNCQVAVGLHAPARFSFAVEAVDYSGAAELAPSVQGLHRVSYYFAGVWSPFVPYEVIRGPFSARWDTHRQIAEDEIVYVPCVNDITMNLSALWRLQPPPGQRPASSLSIDPGLLVRLRWRQCPPQ